MRNKHACVHDCDCYHSHPGSRIHLTYSSSIAPDGTIALKLRDEVDIRAEINSHAMETDMSFILSRLTAGDTSVLNPRTPMFGDFTGLPRTYADMVNLVRSGEEYFESLPAEIKQKFDNNKLQWFAGIGSEEWSTKMGFVKPEPTEKDGVE